MTEHKQSTEEILRELLRVIGEKRLEMPSQEDQQRIDLAILCVAQLGSQIICKLSSMTPRFATASTQGAMTGSAASHVKEFLHRNTVSDQASVECITLHRACCEYMQVNRLPDLSFRVFCMAMANLDYRSKKSRLLHWTQTPYSRRSSSALSR
jgi:hypothetical protein